MEEQQIEIVIVVHDDGIPSVACSVPAHVTIVECGGLGQSDFHASDLNEMAALGMSHQRKDG